jgi:flagellin
MNDLTINGIKIPQSNAADDIFSSTVTTSSNSSASAIAITAAINTQSALTGVRAQANPVVTKATITTVSSDLPAGRYSVYLNGTEVSVYLDPQETPAERRASVALAINERTGQHGVVAKDEGKGGLTLTAPDGRNVSAWFDSSVPALSAASFGLEKGGTAKQVSTITFDSAAITGDTATIVVNDQTITVTATATQDFGALLKAKVEENPYLKNIGVEVDGLTMTFTSKVGGSGFDLSGAAVTGTTVTAMDIATTTPNSTGSNDVTAIYRANETSTTAKTLYGTVRMISDPALLPIGMPSPTGAPPSDKAALLKATGRPFTIAVGEDGFDVNSNFSKLGFESGTFGGQSSAAMDPPRVGRMAFQVGASTKQVITIDLADFGKNGPITSEITGDVDLNVDDRVARINTRNGASDILSKLDNVMDRVNATRATMGAVMNRLDHVINNLTNVSMNLSASRSTIEDADYAAASTELAKTQIMQQAATAVLAQANTSQQSVLKLLGG